MHVSWHKETLDPLQGGSLGGCPADNMGLKVFA